MASQRIVLTSPWKLGLFVFLLVVGCGFGLIYAYLRFFGGTLEFSDEQSLKIFFAVCGAVALLGLLGYTAVVTSSRPLDRVVRGGKTREKLLKKLSEIEDPREADLEEFDAEPAIASVLERWGQDSGAASSAQLAISNQRQALSALASRVQSASEAPEQLSIRHDELDQELAPLVEAINSFIQEVRTNPVSANPEAQETTDTTEVGAQAQQGLASFREAWSDGSERLKRQYQQLLGFASSVAATSEELSRRAHSTLGHGTKDPMSSALLESSAKALSERTGQRLTELRLTLEGLAEESNRLAINAALQVSRLGEQGGELLVVTEEIRSLSTRYQRLTADLRVCEHDQEQTIKELESLARQAENGAAGGNVQGSAGLSPDAIQKVAMVLDQNSGGLQEIASNLRDQLNALQGAVEPNGVLIPADAGSGPARATTGAPAARAPMAEPTETFSMPLPGGLTMEAAEPAAPEAQPVSEEPVYDLTEFGARELPSTSDDEQERVYDLAEFGAVEV